MKITMVSHSDLDGGAARAATRLHRDFLARGLDSQMHVTIKRSQTTTVIEPITQIGRVWSFLRPGLGNALLRLQKNADKSWRSLALLPSFADRRLLAEKPDVINLHWIGNETLSVGEVARLARRCPLVWTLHDMWPFCGAEHYSEDGTRARWRLGYVQSTRPPSQAGLDIDRWTWRRKAAAWQDIPPIHLIAPSRWIAACAAQSELMRTWPVTVIPNPLDMCRYWPIPRRTARQILGLPSDGPILLFGSIGGSEADRKGWNLLEQALGDLASTNPDLICLIIGQEQPANPPKFGLPTRWLGMLHDDTSLGLVYVAVNVTVVPSRQDNLPQMATEAQACGCPVVAFNTCGLPDAVEHLSTGYLAQPFDATDLAYGIRWILADAERSARISEAARLRSKQLWAADVVIPQHIGAYRQAIHDFSRIGRP
ncbi:MAG: glycosyltransferase [Candidatus Accumulibacter propinquus]